MSEERDFWSTQQLAAQAGVDDSYVRRLLIAGKIRGEKLGRQWLIRDEDARAYLLNRERWLAFRMGQQELPLDAGERGEG